MDGAFKIGLVWFLVIVVVPGGVAAFRHELNSWFDGWIIISALSAVLLVSSIRMWAAEP